MLHNGTICIKGKPSKELSDHVAAAAKASCVHNGLTLTAAIIGPNGITGDVKESKGGLFEPPTDGVSILELGAANNALSGVMDEISKSVEKSGGYGMRPYEGPAVGYDIGPVPEDVLKDGIWAASTLEDMVDGAMVLNSVIKSVKKHQDKSKDILPNDIQIGDEYIPEGEMRLPELALKPGAPAYEVVKSTSIYIGNHAAGPVSADQTDYGRHAQVSMNDSNDEIANAVAGLAMISPQEMKDDACKAGYWSMRLPSLKAPVVEKAMLALNFMAGRSSLACAYIDSPQVLFRFDFRRRDFSGMRRYNSYEEGQCLWRGICCDRRNERHRELERQHPGIKPLYAEDIVQLTREDGDALIVSPKEYQEKIPAALIEEYSKLLKGLLIRRFVYSGLNIFVKKSRNDLLMTRNCSEEEIRARELLCEMIGFEEYSKYLRRGFIVVAGRSGQRYVIRGGHSLISVYGKGADGKWLHVEDLCVQFKEYRLAHTDAVIMRKLFVEHDEFELRKKSNATKRDESLDKSREERRKEQRNKEREISRDEILTWESQQDPAQLRQEREQIAAQLGAAFQEQRAG